MLVHSQCHLTRAQRYVYNLFLASAAAVNCQRELPTCPSVLTAAQPSKAVPNDGRIVRAWRARTALCPQLAGPAENTMVHSFPPSRVVAHLVLACLAGAVILWTAFLAGDFVLVPRSGAK